MKKRTMMNRPVLILNGDYQPLSRYPLSLSNMKKVLKSLLKGRISVVKEYDETITVQDKQIKLPKIVVLKKYININHAPKFSRKNVYLRDNYTCQYCGKKFPTEELTFDHVMPRCKGGKTTWENIVTACKCCNGKKGGKTLQEANMKLISTPCIPTNKQLEKNMNVKVYNDNDWFSREYWETELDED